MMRAIEQNYYEKGFASIAGLDEAGKGAWAGPLVSAAVVFSKNIHIDKLNDSKQVSLHLREELFDFIQEKALAIGIGIIAAKVIDELGLGEAHRLSMRKAVEDLGVDVDLLLVDGKGISQLGVKHQCIVKGDQRVHCIAGASIIAKVTRDAIMKKLHEKFPQYGFDRHKGYGTSLHQRAIAEHGIIGEHRLSYKPVFHARQGDLFS